MQQLQDVGDFVTPDLALGWRRAGVEELIDTAALGSLAGQSMSLEVASNTGIGRTRNRKISVSQHNLQVVVQKFRGPRRVLVIERAQRLGRLGADTRERANVIADLIAQHFHRLVAALAT